MTARDPFNELNAAWGNSRVPAALDRRQRVRLIGQFATAMLAGRTPSKESTRFTCGALLAWLQSGGSLERTYLQTTRPKSHHTASFLWREITAHRDERHRAGDADTLTPSDSGGE
jgi:hypothetical protein